VIVLNLVCVSGHRFEGWFASVDAFEKQAAQHLINCPQCNHVDIQRLPSGPHIVKRGSSNPTSREGDDEVRRLLEGLERMANACEDVGDQFPSEARRIHANEAPQRSIKGNASGEELKSLIDDGIPVLPVPKKETRH
jgi:hypothetical protein